jgi:hypothetical protein
MKARIEVIIRDEEGNVIGQMEPQGVELGGQSLYEIEGAVENWRRKALPDIEAKLLDAAQSQFIEQRKKRSTQTKRADSGEGEDPTRTV